MNRTAQFHFSCLTYLVLFLCFSPRSALAAEAAPAPVTPASDPAFEAAQKFLPPADASHVIKLVGKVDGRFIALLNGRVTATGPNVALLINVEEKSPDSSDVRWSPHLFVTTSKGGQVEVVAHQELSAMRYDFDAGTDKGNKLALGTLPLTKDASSLVVTLRKAEGTDKAAGIEEMMAVYLVQKDSLTLAFSQKTESSTAEVVGGVKQSSQDLTQVELGKKATGKLIDLMLTTKKVEKKGDQVNESKPVVDRWCWNDQSAIYMPECK
jgi:hypothetical protein